VELSEVEKLVGELEVGIDRLRSLYEQYFMGIEKLEPTVPRKDVDRRIHVLRKEPFRNTALRFRFQMILQRYNTYQTHWQRILREIEGGTYKRHLMRAQQRFEGRRSTRPPPAPAAQPAPAPELAVPAAPQAAPLTAVAVPAPRVAPPPAPLGFPQPGAALAGRLASELADLELEFGPAQPAAPVAKAAQAPALSALAVPAAGPRPAPPAANAFAPTAKGPPPPPRPLPRPAQTAPAQPRPPEPGPMRPAAAPPPAARPAPAPAPPAPRPAAQASPAHRAAEPSLSDERVRALYSQYVEAKRKQNESTAAITYEGVARTLRDSSAKLREKHGKNVDFEVAVKDGKTVLKPVLR
jgi:hypothetical protein